MIAHLITADVLASEHGTIEKYIEIEGYELLRLLLQGYLDARAENETRLPCVVDVTIHPRGVDCYPDRNLGIG